MASTNAMARFTTASRWAVVTAATACSAFRASSVRFARTSSARFSRAAKNNARGDRTDRCALGADVADTSLERAERGPERDREVEAVEAERKEGARRAAGEPDREECSRGADAPRRGSGRGGTHCCDVPEGPLLSLWSREPLEDGREYADTCDPRRERGSTPRGLPEAARRDSWGAPVCAAVCVATGANSGRKDAMGPTSDRNAGAAANDDMEFVDAKDRTLG